MGIGGPKTILDLIARGYDLGIECGVCARTAVFDPKDVMGHFVMKGWRLELPVDTQRFVCRCGSKRLKALLVRIEQRPPVSAACAPPLTPIYVTRGARGSPAQDAMRRR